MALDEEYMLTVLQKLGIMSPRHVYVCDADTADRVKVSESRHGLAICAFPAGEWGEVDRFATQLFGEFRG
jgi:hypothetical protein